jgi:predicted phage tail component-like protein
MAIKYFTFGGRDSRDYFSFLNKVKRPYLPPLTVPSFKIPGKAGAISQKRNELGTRTIEIDVTLMGTSDADIRTKVRNLASFLVYSTEQDLIFSDELNRKYLARFDTSSTNLEELAEMGEGSISFTCFDPLAYSTVENTLLMGKAETFISDFTNKITGSLTENSHRARYPVGGAPSTALVTPASTMTELSQTAYGYIKTNDYDSVNITTTTNGNSVQFLFSFDVIKALETKYGTSFWKGKTALADKIAWAKKNLTELACLMNGKGSVGTVNKITLGIYNASTGVYSATTVTHSNATDTTQLRLPTSTFDAFIGADGYITFIVYSNASDGVLTASASVNYISLEVKANLQQNEITITNNGTYRLFPRLRVIPTIDCTFIKWTNVTTGKSITYNATWKALEVLIIDTNSNRVYREADGINFIQNITLDSIFFPLEVGANLIRIENQNFDATGLNNQARVYWTERFL